MRAVRLVVAALVAAGAFASTAARPAFACSCVSAPGPTEIAFEGMVTQHREPTDVVRFKVTKVLRGQLPQMIDAHITHNHRLPDGMRQVSTCAIADEVKVGGSYRVEVYRSEFGYFANLCGGSIVAIERLGTDSEQPPEAPSVDTRARGSGTDAGGLLLPAALSFAAFLGLLAIAARARARFELSHASE